MVLEWCLLWQGKHHGFGVFFTLANNQNNCVVSDRAQIIVLVRLFTLVHLVESTCANVDMFVSTLERLW